MNGNLYGTRSWFSFRLFANRKSRQPNIPRPTRQRLKFGLLFQDYMPVLPSVKLYLNLVYNTGLPGDAFMPMRISTSRACVITSGRFWIFIVLLRNVMQNVPMVAETIQ
jgi:hypothetical protein